MNTPQHPAPYGPPAAEPYTVALPTHGPARHSCLPLAIGAAAASLVWGAVLLLTGPSEVKAPEARGYEVSANLCKDAAITELGSLFTANGGEAATLKHKVIDRSECYRELEPKDTSMSSVSTSISFVVHKETDPAPEVIAEAESAGYAPGSKATVKTIEGLGDHAFLVTTDLKNTRMVTLTAVDGGAEYSIRLTGSDLSTSDKSRLYSARTLEPLLVKDAKATLAKLKH